MFVSGNAMSVSLPFVGAGSGNRAALIVGLSGAAVSAVPALALLAGVRVPRVRRVLVASAGITPGGLGVIEVTMTAGLVAAGLPAKSALVGVLVYRAVSFWLVVAVGWLVAARLGSRPDVLLEAEAELAGSSVRGGED